MFGDVRSRLFLCRHCLNDKMNGTMRKRPALLESLFGAEGKAYTASSFYDDFHFTESLALSPSSITYVMDDECLYCLMPSEQFLELAESAKSPVIENLIRQYDVTEQSNPILMKCRLKVD